MGIRRRRLWFVLIAGVVVAGWVWWWAVGTALSTAGAVRVTDGMTKDEVFAILGKPKPVVPFAYFPGQYVDMWGFDYWDATDGMIMIRYDQDGLVNGRDVRTDGALRWQWRRLKYYIGF